jgi:hypothetical protein
MASGTELRTITTDLVEILLGVKAEQQSLESIARRTR